MNEDSNPGADEQSDGGGTAGEGDTVEEAIARGETVRTEVVEQATLESELVDIEEVDRELVGSEVLTEDVAGVALVEGTDPDLDAVDEVFEADDRFSLREDDADPDDVDEAVIAIRLDEARSEIEEVYERKTIETTVVEEDQELDVEVEGVHQQVLDSDLVRTDADEVARDEVVIEGEFVEGGDAVRSHLTERKTVEREVGGRKLLAVPIADVHAPSGTVRTEQTVERELVDVEEVPEVDAEIELDAEEEVGMAETDATETAAPVSLTEDDVGKDAVLPSGDEIGLVSKVDPDENTVYVEPDPGLTDKLKADLNWGGEEGAYSLDGSRVERITGDAVVVESVD